MALKNSATAYGLLAKTFHWSVAVGVWTLIYLGLQQSGMDSGPEKSAIRVTHGSIALIVLVLMTARLVWRFVDAPPKHVGDLPGWQLMTAHLTHWGIYLAVFVQLIAGFMTVATYGKPIPFFNLFSIPTPVAEDSDAHHFWEEIHEFMWIPLVALLTLHVAAALFNHFVRKNDTLKRMTMGVE
jgi:cytochrome b561